MGSFVLVISFLVPTLLEFIGSNMVPLSICDSLLLGGLRVVYWPLICFNTVQGVSNDVKVVWRFVFSVPFAILLFFVGATSQQYFWFSLGMYLPYILLINLFTWKNYVDFVGTDSGNIAKDAQSMARQRLTSFYS
jgi:hypothetical protein